MAMDETTVMIVSACQQVVQSWRDYNIGYEPNSKKVLKDIDTLEILMKKTKEAVDMVQVDLMT